AYLNQTERLQDRDELVDLCRLSSHFQYEMFHGRIDHLCLEGISKTQCLCPVFTRPDNLDQRHFALDRSLLSEIPCTNRQVNDPMDGHDALQLRLDLLEHDRRSSRDNRDAREMRFMLGLRNRQTFDIVAAAGKQTDDPGKDARFITDE